MTTVQPILRPVLSPVLRNVTSSRAGGGVKAFISTWKTDNAGTSNDDQITLPLEINGTYDFTVDWGDGNSDTITAYDQAEVTHTYSSAGTYTIEIKGTIEGWQFDGGGDCKKITDVSQWYGLIIGNNTYYFYGCSNMTVSATDELDVSGCGDLSGAFRDCNSMTSLITTNWDVSSIILQGLNRTFYGCMFLELLDVSLWDISSVEDMSYFFFNTDALDTNDYGGIKNWDITSLTGATGFMGACTNSLSTADYDDVLVNWEAQDVNDNVTIGFNNSTYTAGSAAETARTALVEEHGWVITDGGAAA